MPKPGKKTALMWMLLALSLASCWADPPTRFTVEAWGPDRGLPSSGVISVMQSEDGFLWLGTLKGLIRFDGVHFTPLEQDDASWLTQSRVVRIFEDSEKKLWLGTESDGVAVVKNGQVIRMDIGQRTREGHLLSVGDDSTGAVWLHTLDGGLYRYKEGKLDLWKHREDPLNPLKIAADKSGPLWLVDGKNLFRIDPSLHFSPPDQIPGVPVKQGQIDYILPGEKGGVWLFIDGRVQKWTKEGLLKDFGPYPWAASGINKINTACEDRDGNLVVGTLQQGVFWLNRDGLATQISTNNGLLINQVLSVCVDREGTLWVGTDGGGLNRVIPHLFNVLEESKGLTVRTVAEDLDGGLWYGAFGGGLNVWQKGKLQSLMYTNFPYISILSPRCLLADRETVWLADEDERLGLLRVDRGSLEVSLGLPDKSRFPGKISSLLKDHSGGIWIGTHDGLACWSQNSLQRYTTNNGLSANEITALAEDVTGRIWIGTSGGGLTSLKAGKFDTHRRHDPDGLSSDEVSSLLADGDGALWVATADRGLARFKDEKWTRFTAADGLPSNSVGNLIDDDRGNLWMQCDSGVIRIPKRALNAFAQHPTNTIPCSIYSRTDGLPTAESFREFQPGPCRTQIGRLWFPTTKGLAGVFPGDIHPNTNPPPIVVESVLIDGLDQNTNGLRGKLPATIIMHPRQERLDIQFSSLNLGAPERSRLKYRLSGHETAWTDLGNARPGVARYTKLQPGPYQFEVMAANEDGLWNEAGTLFSLVVQPPFWRTKSFITLAVLSLLAAVTGVVYYYSTQRLQHQLEGLRQQQALEKERQRIARDIHDQLGASLTQLAMLGELAESDKDLPEEVESHARQIQQSARDTSRVLDEIVWAVNPSNDTLEGLINYYCKYAQEYLTIADMRYRLDVPAQLPATPIPPDVRHNVFLAAKEAVTNVVRHAKATACWIRMRWEPGSFTLEIEDNGAGMAGMDEKRARTRNGLSNMRKRLEEIGGSCTFSPGAEGGTLVRLVAPLGKTPEIARK